MDKSPQSGAPEKVGILYHSIKEDEDEGDYEVNLYMVDISLLHSYYYTPPAVRFIFPGRTTGHAFCVLRSTLYIFGGYDLRRPCPPESEKKYAKRFVLPGDIDNDILVNVKKDGTVLDSIPIMRHLKSFPQAVPTPDGRKILVFSSLLSPLESVRTFELFDPQKNEWEDLPVLPWNYDSLEQPPFTDQKNEWEDLPVLPWNYDSLEQPPFTEVQSYSFIGECHFFVETELGSYALDLVKREWSRLYTPRLPACGYFVMAKDRYAITPGTAYHLLDDGFLAQGIFRDRDFHRVTFAPPSPPQPFHNPPSILPLDPIIEGEGEARDGEVCNTCFLRIETACNDSGYEARLLIDVCRTELACLRTNVYECGSFRIGLTSSLSEFSLISVS
ncbi:hypothetical protein ACS0TY_005134 [Phlomoides rotata]